MSVIHGVCLCKFACSLTLIGDRKINTRHAFAVLYRHVQSGDKFESLSRGGPVLVPAGAHLHPSPPCAHRPRSPPTCLPSLAHPAGPLCHPPAPPVHPVSQTPTRLQVLKVGNVIVGRLLHQPLQLPVRQVLHFVIQTASLLLCQHGLLEAQVAPGDLGTGGRGWAFRSCGVPGKPGLFAAPLRPEEVGCFLSLPSCPFSKTLLTWGHRADDTAGREGHAGSPQMGRRPPRFNCTRAVPTSLPARRWQPMVLPTSFMLHVTWKISCRSPSWPSRLLQEISLWVRKEPHTHHTPL